MDKFSMLIYHDIESIPTVIHTRRMIALIEQKLSVRALYFEAIIS